MSVININQENGRLKVLIYKLKDGNIRYRVCIQNKLKLLCSTKRFAKLRITIRQFIQLIKNLDANIQ